MGKILLFKNWGDRMENDRIEKDQELWELVGQNKSPDDIANLVLTYFNSNDVPINPIHIAKELGIRVVNANFTENDISGMLLNDNGEWIIYVKESETPDRKRFTIAHELGHYMMHKQHDEFVSEYFRRSNEDRQDFKLEREANTFAATLLMPEESVFHEWKFCYPSVDVMALRFGVSFEAMKIRLTNLGISSMG